MQDSLRTGRRIGAWEVGGAGGGLDTLGQKK